MTQALPAPSEHSAPRAQRFSVAHASLVLAGLAASAVTGTGAFLALAGAVGLGVWVGLHRSLFRQQHGFGAPNLVTSLRVVLAVLLCSAPRLGGESSAAIAFSVLALDGLDGWLARRTDRATDFGARFDMETDAFFIAAASFAVFVLGRLGGVVLIAGALRYVYVLALAALRRSDADAPRTRLGRHVFAIIALSLIVALPPLADFYPQLAYFALALLTLSFARSFAWSLAQPRSR